MKRIDQWKAKLRAAKAALPIRQREAKSAARALERVQMEIIDLEKKIERYVA